MKKLDKRDNITGIDFEPNEGERTLLSSNESDMRSPSLDLGINANSTEEELIKVLARILVEGFLAQYENGANDTT